MAISLTESAATRVKTFLAARGPGIGLRLGVRKTGCSGFAYVINYADGPDPGDAIFEDRGVRVFVDASSLKLIDGTIGSIECRTTQVIDAGDHRALVGEVVGASVGEGDPLVFFRSGYADRSEERRVGKECA